MTKIIYPIGDILGEAKKGILPISGKEVIVYRHTNDPDGWERRAVVDGTEYDAGPVYRVWNPQDNVTSLKKIMIIIDVAASLPLLYYHNPSGDWTMELAGLDIVRKESKNRNYAIYLHCRENDEEKAEKILKFLWKAAAACHKTNVIRPFATFTERYTSEYKDGTVTTRRVGIEIHRHNGMPAGSLDYVLR